jgi:hypothetical protein
MSFADDAARVEFLRRNAVAIVRLTPTLMLASHPDQPELQLISSAQGCETDTSFGIDDVQTASPIEVTTKESLAARLAFRDVSQTWDHDSPRRCVGTVPHRGETATGLMEDIAMSGLRDPIVHSDGANIYFSADEECALVELMVSHSDANDRARFCEDSSHRACGDPTQFSVSGVAEVQERQ